MAETIVCHRCPGVVMEDDGEWYRCPCCRTNTRGLARTRARWEERATEMGMTLDEYHEHMRERAKQLGDAEPPSAELLAKIEGFAKRMKEEWVPACEHDTNPWA